MTRTLVTLTFILLGPPLAMVSLAEVKTTKMGAKKKGSNGCVSFAEDDRVKLKKVNRDVVIFEVTNGCSEESTITIRALETGGLSDYCQPFTGDMGIKLGDATPFKKDDTRYLACSVSPTAPAPAKYHFTIDEARGIKIKTHSLEIQVDP